MDFFNQRKSANKISMDGRTFKEKLEWFYEKSTERLELNAKENLKREFTMREEENKSMYGHGT